MAELCDLSAVELRRLIGTKAISPVELLDSCIARIEAVNPAVNAVVATCYERARAEAKAAEAAAVRGAALGPLHGLPIGVKDLQDTEGLRTTYASPLFANHVPEKDERTVAAIRAAGGIVVAKTNTPEFGTGGNTTNEVYGPTGNAFDPELSCGGSSGGSGVALATSMLPLCTGSDTGGSLRKPAAWSGVVGFRSSPGLVPSEKRRQGWVVFSVLGPMGRDVADACLLMGAMAGSDSRDPLANPLLEERHIAGLSTPQPVDLARLRVALSVDLGFAPIAPSIRATFEERTGMFRGAFASCEEHDPDMEGIDRAYRVIRCTNFFANFREHYERDPGSLGRNTRVNYEEGIQYTLADFAEAHATHTRVYRAFQEYFRELDLLITPCQAMSPFPKKDLFPTDLEGRKLTGYFDTSGITYGITMTANPAICIPCGLDPKGMPFGLQIVARRGADAFLLGAAHALERHLASLPECRRPIPDLGKLAAGTPQAVGPK